MYKRPLFFCFLQILFTFVNIGKPFSVTNLKVG